MSLPPPNVDISQLSTLVVTSDELTSLSVFILVSACPFVTALTTEGDHVMSDVHAHARACEACQSPEAPVYQQRVTNIHKNNLVSISQAPNLSAQMQWAPMAG